MAEFFKIQTAIITPPPIMAIFIRRFLGRDLTTRMRLAQAEFSQGILRFFRRRGAPSLYRQGPSHASA